MKIALFTRQDADGTPVPRCQCCSPEVREPNPQVACCGTEAFQSGWQTSGQQGLVESIPCARTRYIALGSHI